MRKLRNFLFFLPTAWVATQSTAAGKFIHISYINCVATTNFSPAQLESIRQLKWYFAHASVGANMMEGLADLHKADAQNFSLQTTTSASTPPAITQNGILYECNRGNPGWKAKLDAFQDSISNGWRFPKIDLAMNKLCYIDQFASASYYINSMSNLEAACRETVFVYTTMPLTTSEDGENALRNAFNNRVRDWCRANGRVLFDLADIEAHDPSGALCEFKYRGKTCQRLCGVYTTDGGHLNPQGRMLVARGFYALAGALPSKSVEAASK